MREGVAKHLAAKGGEPVDDIQKRLDSHYSQLSAWAHPTPGAVLSLMEKGAHDTLIRLGGGYYQDQFILAFRNLCFVGVLVLGLLAEFVRVDEWQEQMKAMVGEVEQALAESA